MGQLTSAFQTRGIQWPGGAVLSGLLAAMLLVAGCQTTASMKSPAKGTYTVAVATYDISLISVERPAESVRRYGEQRLAATPGEGGQRFFSFEDNLVRIKWHPTSDDIAFMIGNKTDGPLKVLWDEAAFIDEQGKGHRLIHAGSGYEDRNAVHPPTVIAAWGTLNDFIHSADSFKPEEDYGKRAPRQVVDWMRAPFLPERIKGTAGELRPRAEAVVGKTFRVILPVEADNLRNDYTYTFRIDNVAVTEIQERIDGKPDDKREGETGRPGPRRRGGFP